MESPLGWHIIFRARDSRVLAPDMPAQRALAEVAHRVGARFGLLAFRAPDDHFHTMNRCTRKEGSAFAQALGSAITQVLGVDVGLHPAYFERLKDQGHLDNTFAYILGNQENHKADIDPMHDASSIQELLGLRLGPEGYIDRVRKRVRRVNREMLLRLLGVKELTPFFSADWLAEAAAGALTLPCLDGSRLATRACSAAVRMAADRVRPMALAGALGISPRTLRRLRATENDEPLERAIALRMGLRRALGARVLPTRPFK